MVTSHCTLHRKDSNRACLHVVAARFGCEKVMVGTGLATPHSDCKDRLRKHYSHLAGGWFLARKAAWALSGYMATNSAAYCMLVNEWVWLKVTRQGEVGGVTGRVLCTW